MHTYCFSKYIFANIHILTQYMHTHIHIYVHTCIYIYVYMYIPYTYIYIYIVTYITLIGFARTNYNDLSQQAAPLATKITRKKRD